MAELVSGMPAPQFGDEDQSRFKVQAVPVFLFDWCEMIRVPQVADRWFRL
jgi:hypothetical protein